MKSLSESALAKAQSQISTSNGVREAKVLGAADGQAPSDAAVSAVPCWEALAPARWVAHVADERAGEQQPAEGQRADHCDEPRLRAALLVRPRGKTGVSFSAGEGHVAKNRGGDRN